MKLTLRQLEYFIALAEMRHFGHAAAKVHISQPALSVQIKELEATLGGPLVERHARDLTLTPFGRLALEQAKEIVAQVRALEHSARWRDGLAGKLVIGMIPTVAPYLLPSALAELRARDLSLDVQVQEAKTARLLTALQQGELDAAVIALPAEAIGLVERPIFDDRFLLAGSHARIANLGQSLEELRPVSLDPDQLLLLEDGHCLTEQALEVCGRSNHQINMGASSLATLSRMVAAGFGLTLLPEIAAVTECRAAPDMALSRFHGPEPNRTIGLVRRDVAGDDGWFTELGDILTRVGEELVQDARAAF